MSRAAAARVCADFKDRRCDSADEVLVEWPSRPVVLGRAVEIVYRSNKWISKDERDRGAFQDYFHPFESEVEVVICGDSDLADEEKVDRAANPRGSLSKPPGNVAQLADTLELTFSPADGGDDRLLVVEEDRGLGNNPPLLAFERRGKVTLVIALDDGAIVLRGGDMQVRPEGITG